MDRQTEMTEVLRDLALDGLGMDLFGVASPERLAGAPEGRRPTDYMPGANAVVVCASKIPDAAIDVAGRYDEPGKTLAPYMWYGYVTLNWDLSSAVNRMVRFLERRGFKALPFPPTGLLYKYGNVGDFSHRHAAVAAGLGEFGFNGLVLTPEFGARQRLVSIITDAPLAVSPMYDGQALCQPQACGYACIRACPTKAMTGRTSFDIGGRTQTHAKLKGVKCKWLYAEKGYRRTKVPMPPAPTDEDWRAVQASTKPHPFDAALNQFTFVPHCGACIFSCPSPRFETCCG
ncbi:MAG: epoxyqueuosine reductase [Burkholderiales bacterium]|nr:epoxyqueuosine reductase [Burkholderiales bacterium]